MTNHPNGGGISKKNSWRRRDKIKSHIEALNVPENMSVIIELLVLISKLRSLSGI